MMFVTRARYERELADAIADANHARYQLDGMASRFDALLEKYHALKLAGANTPAPPVAPLPRTKPTPVDEVIGTVAGSNSRLRKQLKDYEIQQRFAGADDAEIAHALLNWDEDDSGVAE